MKSNGATERVGTNALSDRPLFYGHLVDCTSLRGGHMQELCPLIADTALTCRKTAKLTLSIFCRKISRERLNIRGRASFTYNLAILPFSCPSQRKGMYTRSNDKNHETTFKLPCEAGMYKEFARTSFLLAATRLRYHLEKLTKNSSERLGVWQQRATTRKAQLVGSFRIYN